MQQLAPTQSIPEADCHAGYVYPADVGSISNASLWIGNILVPVNRQPIATLYRFVNFWTWKITCPEYISSVKRSGFYTFTITALTSSFCNNDHHTIVGIVNRLIPWKLDADIWIKATSVGHVQGRMAILIFRQDPRMKMLDDWSSTIAKGHERNMSPIIQKCKLKRIVF